MRVLGMISGTSHDGIDVAIVNFTPGDEPAPGAVRAQIEHSASTPYPAALRERLIAALPPSRVGLDTVCELDTEIGQEFARAAVAAITAHGDAGYDPVDLICSHGQTVFHWVEGGAARGTLQIGQPAWIAEASGVPVLSDIRSADLAAGGQGAPLVPLLDRILLRPFVDSGLRAAALNLGGISNATVISEGEDPVAWDIGPANALIDAVVTDSAETTDTFDVDGALASAGTVDDELLASLLAEPYYALPAPKSSGKELFHLSYVREHLARRGTDDSGRAEPRLVDLVATLTELTARTVSDAIRAADVDVLVSSGGGVRNPVLMRRIAELLPGVRMNTTGDLGVDSDIKEAVAFALIGWATAHGLPGNVPSCTGAAGERVLGRIEPGPSGTIPRGEGLTSMPDLSFETIDRRTA
ncbi:anhydro-N-acetylmuramic acid kinase [Microbacterium esteraromaticum]|nr:anhydro-N-acetylmuramic acid kinase [Microbacterium esteraromaticum]